jgi:alpha-tubulin suppressor-like RCC1 family protein
LTKSRLLKKSLPLPEAEGSEGPESSEVTRTVALGKKAKKLGRDDWTSNASVKLKPEIAVAPLANRVKPDDDWVPMDKESMAKFKEKRSAATTEKVEDAIPPLRTSKLKPVLSPLNVESVLQQLQDAKPNGTLRADMAGQFGDVPEVWTCGQNSYGELAHLDTSTRKTFSFVECLKDKDVIHVAAGNEHTVVLTRSGDAYTAGYNDNGQCGHGSTQRIGQLLRVDKLHGKGSVQVHAYNGCEHTLVVLRDGRLVSFGYNYRGQLGHGNTASEAVPKLVRGLENRSVCNVSCSYYHTVISCEDGAVFSFGRNDFGQLGHGDTTDRKVPRLIESLRGQRTTGLACGQYHTCVSTLDGRVLSCGKNDYGQLGVDSSENHRIMVPVYGLVDNEIISEVRCGYYHTIALAKGGHVFGFGRNDYGQLGLGHVTPRVYGPNIVDQLEGKGIVRVAAGCYHSIVVGANGMLYVFGRNNHGQLGTGDTNEQHSPWPVDRFLGKRVAMVAAGFYHSIVLTGGIERDEASTPPVVEASPYSADFLLGLPSLCLSPERSNFDLPGEKNVPVDRGHVAGDGGLSASLEIESKELAFPEEDDLHGTAAELHVVTDARPTSLADSLKMLAMLDPVQSLVDKNGTVEPERAAIFILAHMDRLSSACAPASGVPFVAGQPQPPSPSPGQGHVEDLPDGARRERHLYCVDICPETFETILALLMFLHRDMQTLPRFDDGESASCYQQLYQPSMILACLRILTANLAEFIRSPISTTVMGSMAAHRSEEEQLNGVDLRVQRLFTASSSEQPGYEQQRENVLFGLPCMLLNGQTKLPNTDTSELGRFRAVLGALQRQLLALVLEPVSIDAAELIQAEAAAILILGVELFYPSQAEKVNLLAELLTTVETALQEDPLEEGFNLGSVTRTGRHAARHFILNPLLQRLAHDSLSSKLIPPAQPSASNLLEPSAGVLATLLRLLVKRLVTESSPPSEHSDPIEVPLLLHGASALPGRNQCGTAHVNFGDETYTLLTDFLLTLQKHLMSWAGRQSSSDGCILDWDDDDGELQPGGYAVGATLDASISIAALLDSSVPSGWNCLLEYSQMLLLHSIELLTNLVGTTGPGSNGNSSYLGHRTGSTNGADVTSLRRSLVGSILPPLVTGLLPFASEPIFAKRLMKLVTRFAQLLDALCFATPELRSVDANYIKYRLGEGTPLNGTTSKVGDMAGPRADSAVEVPKLPWLLSLLKTTASLAGRLAGTMVIGNGNCHSLMESRCVSPVCREWIKSPVFARGLSIANCNLLARHGVIPMNMDDPCDTSAIVFGSGSFYADVLAGDKSVDLFCDWLRTSYAKFDQGYSIISRQAFRSPDALQFRTFEKTTLAALLQLNGLSGQASMYKHMMSGSGPAEALLPQRSPPVRFLALWRVVSEVRPD